MTITTARPSGYALDPEWHAERARLDSLTSLYDDGTLAACSAIGVAAGWKCLDVGAGTGTLARALVDRVAPAGGVVAADIDTRFLEPIVGPGLEAVQLDVTRDQLPQGGFDLVHARLLLEHLPTRDEVLTRMIEATSPGGWVLIEDFDWATAYAVDPPSAVHDRVTRAVQAFFTEHGYDATYGRTLPRRLAAAGLADVRTRAVSVQVASDADAGLPAWELLVDQFAPGLLAAGLLDQEDLDRFHELWHDGDTICFSPLMVSCWGRVPAETR